MAGAVDSAVDELIQLLLRPHVPPFLPPFHTAAVPNNNAAKKDGKCAFWPICDMDTLSGEEGARRKAMCMAQMGKMHAITQQRS
jgi:hypothetical protein